MIIYLVNPNAWMIAVIQMIKAVTLDIIEPRWYHAALDKI